jgi:hypothetical protein
LTPRKTCAFIRSLLSGLRFDSTKNCPNIAIASDNQTGAFLKFMQQLQTEVLVVGGGTGGTAAAIQAARRGAQTILVSEFSWLGGMLTAAGVSAPDGNELAALQTGLWGAFLRELDRRQAGGLDHAWVSFFTYEPRVGAEIFADWVRSLPNLHWIQGQVPLAAYKQGDRITQVRFADYAIDAQIILDATELGDLLALADVPHRWGWEWQADFGEPSAPIAPNELTQKYPVQSPTWVVVLKDFEADAPEISQPPLDRPEQFAGAWQGYEPEAFLNYGRLPGNRFMINWPQQGNDYGARLDRLLESATTRRELLQEACWHSQSFARHIQSQLGCRYGLAETTFPAAELGWRCICPASLLPREPSLTGKGDCARARYFAPVGWTSGGLADRKPAGQRDRNRQLRQRPSLPWF